MTPRDIVKLAFQYQEHPEIPFDFRPPLETMEKLTAHYGDERWREWAPPYIFRMTGVDSFFSLAGYEQLPDGFQRDRFGSVWQFGHISRLVEAPLKEPSLKGFRLPDLDEYYETHVKPKWSEEIEQSEGSFRVISHSFGLFERAWSLRGFENFLMDLHDAPEFCEALLDTITEWLLESIEHMLALPVDAIFLTDDYADQRGIIFGIERFRSLFKPRWKRLFGRIKKAGVYSILHTCGCAVPAVPDLIECGLDCLQTLQPEAMDIYQLKRDYGRDIRLWGGLGSQSTLPFGKPDDVRTAVRRLKQELGCGGGYILSPAKPITEQVPLENVVACLEEAHRPVAR